MMCRSRGGRIDEAKWGKKKKKEEEEDEEKETTEDRDYRCGGEEEDNNEEEEQQKQNTLVGHPSNTTNYVNSKTNLWDVPVTRPTKPLGHPSSMTNQTSGISQ